jgi:hypothetical protein
MAISAQYGAYGRAIHTGTSAWLGRHLTLIHNAIPYHGERFLHSVKAV